MQRRQAIGISFLHRSLRRKRRNEERKAIKIMNIRLLILIKSKLGDETAKLYLNIPSFCVNCTELDYGSRGEGE
jgi:hypothetical protein